VSVQRPPSSFFPARARLARSAWGGLACVALLWAATVAAPPRVGAAAVTATPASVAAYVNTNVITYGELAQRTALYGFLAPTDAAQFAQPQLQSLILERMIQEALVVQAAAHAHLSLGRTSFAAQALKSYDSLLGKAYANVQAMDQALRTDHLTRAEVIGYIELELALDNVLQRLVRQAPIPAAAIRAYYQAHLSQFEAPTAYALRVIVVPTKAEAETILHEVVADHGANFGALAEAKSIDTASAPEQGDLGWVTLSELSGAVAKAVPLMKVGGYALADTANGWDVLQLLAIRPPGRQSLSAATVAITKTLVAQHFQTSAKAYLAELSKQAKIRVLWHPVGGAGTSGGGSSTGTSTGASTGSSSGG
jgi:parvulin-like peptidyl-prolyl isomerase